MLDINTFLVFNLVSNLVNIVTNYFLSLNLVTIFLYSCSDSINIRE